MNKDIGINLHHWHWHLVYPFTIDPTISKKDRRGELFYYMHHQIVTRYILINFIITKTRKSFNYYFIFRPNGERMPLDDETGIDVFGNQVEASSLSLHFFLPRS
ncbi:phenoloxidase subunit 1-like [Battus philenor]|uniref:phenoloxidase subunit 1-like n=1 Tax=Battus philenor TaxID=42288 RepID=UPI0035CF3ECD